MTNKHMLRVVYAHGFPVSDSITFYCVHCSASLTVSRVVLEGLLIKQDDRLVGVGFGTWSNCPLVKE